MAIKGSPLADRGINAAKWSYLGNICRLTLQFGVGVVLARLLGPAAFGTVAIAWLMISIGMLVADFGFGNALIQKSNLHKKDVHFVFTVQILIGSVLSISGVLSAGLVAMFFESPEAEPVVRWMSLLFFIKAAGQAPTAILSRGLRFKRIHLATLFTYIIGFIGIGIPAAFLGYGVWSLVWAQLAQALLYTVFIFVGHKYPLGLSLTAHSGGLAKFGGKVIAAHLASWVILNVDSLLIGRNLGAVPLGIYNRAMNLVLSPASAATMSLQSVLFAACALAQSDLRQVKRGYLSASSAIVLICAPFFITVAVVPEATVMGLYGSAWSDAIPLLTPLALAMLVHAILALIGPVLMGLNHTGKELAAQYATALVVLPLVYFASIWSVAAVAWTVLVAYLLRLTLLFLALATCVPVSAGELARALKYPFVLGLLCAASASGVDFLASGLSAELRLLLVVASAAIFTALYLVLMRRMIFAGDLGTMLRSEGRLPARLRWLVN